jgi:hypothetical protein
VRNGCVDYRNRYGNYSTLSAWLLQFSMFWQQGKTTRRIVTTQETRPTLKNWYNLPIQQEHTFPQEVSLVYVGMKRQVNYASSTCKSPSSPSPGWSDVQRVKLSLSNCIISVLSLYDSSDRVSNSAMASSKAYIIHDV